MGPRPVGGHAAINIGQLNQRRKRPQCTRQHVGQSRRLAHHAAQLRRNRATRIESEQTQTPEPARSEYAKLFQHDQLAEHASRVQPAAAGQLAAVQFGLWRHNEGRQHGRPGARKQGLCKLHCRDNIII